MESELGRVVDALPGFVWTAFPGGQIDFMNQRWSEYTGLEVDASYGRGWQVAIHPEDLARLLAGWRGGPASGAPVETEVRLRGSDGHYRWFLFRAHPSADASGQVVKWCGMSTDIDDRMRAAEALRAREHRFRLIVDELPVLLSTATPDGELEQANRHYLDYFGATLKELKAREAPHGLHPDDQEPVRSARRAAIDAGRPYEIECRRRRADGVYRWFFLRAFPLRDAEGRIALWYRLQIDIDEQKRAEALLAGEKQLLEMVASGRPMSDILAALCRLVEDTASGCYCSVVLVDPSGANLQEAIAPSLAPEFNESVRNWPLDRIGGPCVMAARDKVQVIMSDVASDARWRNSWRGLAQAHGLRSCWSTPIVSQAGKVLGTFALYQREPGSPNSLQLELIAHFTHIASIAIERAQRDEALRQSEARAVEAERELQRTIDNIPARVGTYSADGSHEFVNDWVRKISGISAVEDWRIAIHPDDIDLLERKWRACIASGEPFEMEYRSRADGAYRWYVSRRVPARDETGKVTRWYAVNYDIEDRKRAEDALRQSEARRAEAERELQLTIDSIPTLVATYRPDGARVFVNQTWRDYSGLTLDNAMNVDRLGASIVHLDDTGRFAQEWQMALAAETPLKIEVRLRRADGEYRWHAMHRVPARDEAGAIVKWYSVAIDIEERKRAEDALRQSEHHSRLIVDSIPGLVAIFTPNGEVESVNRQLLEYFGRTTEELTHWGASDAAHPEDLPKVVESFAKSIASGDPFDFEVRARRSDGIYRWFQSRGLPLRDTNGSIVRWYNLLIDIEERKRAEDALRQSEARLAEAQRELQLTIDTIPAMVATYEPDGVRSFVNQQWQNYAGRTLEEATGEGRHITRHFHPDDSETANRAWRNALATGEPLSLDMRIRRADGEYRWHTHHCVPLCDEQGTIVKWYAAEIDIEDKKRAESARLLSEARLAETERELRQTLDSIPTITWRAGPNGYVQQLNKRWYEYTGTTPEQVRGWRWKLCVHPDDLDQLVAIGNEYVATGRSIDGEARLRRHDGTYRWFLFRPAPAHDETGKVVGWYGAITDIEDRKRAEEKVAEAERELRRAIDGIPAIVTAFHADGSLLFMNERAAEFLGRSNTGDIRNTIHPDDVDLTESKWRACIASGEPFEVEVRTRRFDGTYRWHRRFRVPLRDEAGNVVRWYGVGFDIEDQKRAEEALRASEVNLRKIINTIPTAAWSTRPDGYWDFLSDRWLDYAGFSAEQAQGWGWGAGIHPDDVNGLVAYWQSCLASGTPVDTEARMRRFDGAYRWFLFRANPLRDEAGNIIKWYGTNVDIEDRKRTEQELRRSEIFLAQAQRLSSTGSFSWRVATNECTLSEEAYRIYDIDPAVPVTFELIRTRVHPENLAKLQEVMDQARRGTGDFDYESRLLMPDRTVKYIHVAAQGGLSQDSEFELIGAVQDVTQRRLAEEARDKVRSELAHVTRVMSFGALTASIAHEVNQPLAGIVTNASTCLRMLAADPPNVEGARETARRTIRDGNRAADVIARLRALFSKKGAAAETVDLNEATHEVIALVSSDLQRSRVILRAELGSEPLLITGDRVQLQQVILNLVRNASDAMSDVDDRPRSLLVKTYAEDDERARLTVKDVGVGFEPQGAERLFDAFYTTKSGGMGIGLSVSRSIIENHGGKLWAEQNDGPGATFSFSIPRQATSAGDQGTAGAISTRPTRGAHDLMRNAE